MSYGINKTNPDGQRHFQYQTVQPPKNGIPPRVGTRSFDGAEELLKMGMDWFTSSVWKLHLAKALLKLEPDVKKQMPNSEGGVLLGVVSQQAYSLQDFSSKLFMYAYIMGGGSNMMSVFNRYQYIIRNGTISSGVFNEGWYKVEDLLWVTR